MTRSQNVGCIQPSSIRKQVPRWHYTFPIERDTQEIWRESGRERWVGELNWIELNSIRIFGSEFCWFAELCLSLSLTPPSLAVVVPVVVSALEFGLFINKWRIEEDRDWEGIRRPLSKIKMKLGTLTLAPSLANWELGRMKVHRLPLHLLSLPKQSELPLLIGTLPSLLLMAIPLSHLHPISFDPLLPLRSNPISACFNCYSLLLITLKWF